MTEAEKMAERLESVTLFQSYEYNLALNNEAAALIRRLQAENNRLSGRLCVNCGRTFPANHDRAKAPEDCPSQDACTIDMTLEEAFNHWRQKAHDYRAEIDTKNAFRMQGEAQVASLLVEIVRLRAENEILRAREVKMVEALKPLVDAAYGLSFGEDWNNGTQAKLHGHRQKLIDAVPRARAAHLLYSNQGENT
jgi:hypothetical protein